MLPQEEHLIKALKDIVESIQVSRPRGWHIYPTELRDKAVNLLSSINVKVKDYQQCQLDTEQQGFFDLDIT